MKDLQITVDFHKARAGGMRAAAVDIAALLAAFPRARILAGDPSISVQVRVDERERALVAAAVEQFCVIEDYSPLDLY
jgi:xanthine dehydrogenase iron-sulfur cluster and FAD-binding subunit A